jgi:glycosyltransferase involved in cell wall biosynthesis
VSSTAGALRPISEPYLLIVSVPIEIDEHGQRWTHELWAKDLALHLEYLENLTLASPVRPRRSDDPLVPLDVPPFDRITFVDLRSPSSRVGGLISLPDEIWRLWRAIGQSRIVHTGFGGWPINDGWLAAPLAKIRRRFLLTNVESSFWRAAGSGVSWHRKLRSSLGERLSRFCVRIADLRLFTSKAYLSELLPAGSPRAYVTPATWIDEDWILDEVHARAAWAAKEGPVQLLFAGRLIAEKGVSVLLAALKIAAAAGAEAHVAIIGAGDLREECVKVAAGSTGRLKLNVLDPIPYGKPFLALLRGFDAVVVPSISDEQPRILFDAFSQAVPVIGSATGGICEVVQSELTGRLVPPGDAGRLADALIWASGNRPDLRAMGLRALEKARTFTHRAMHTTRHQILLEHLLPKQLERPLDERR